MIPMTGFVLPAAARYRQGRTGRRTASSPSTGRAIVPADTCRPRHPCPADPAGAPPRHAAGPTDRRRATRPSASSRTPPRNARSGRDVRDEGATMDLRPNPSGPQGCRPPRRGGRPKGLDGRPISPPETDARTPAPPGCRRRRGSAPAPHRPTRGTGQGAPAPPPQPSNQPSGSPRSPTSGSKPSRAPSRCPAPERAMPPEAASGAPGPSLQPHRTARMARGAGIR